MVKIDIFPDYCWNTIFKEVGNYHQAVEKRGGDFDDLTVFSGGFSSTYLDLLLFLCSFYFVDIATSKQ
jgi:hypothetical protein